MEVEGAFHQDQERNIDKEKAAPRYDWSILWENAPTEFIPMNSLVWICQGAASRGFLCVLNDMLKRHKIDLLSPLEMKASGQHADIHLQKYWIPKLDKSRVGGLQWRDIDFME